MYKNFHLLFSLRDSVDRFRSRVKKHCLNEISILRKTWTKRRGNVCICVYYGLFESAWHPIVTGNILTIDFFFTFCLFYIEVITGNFLHSIYYIPDLFLVGKCNFFYRLIDVYKNGRPFCCCSNKCLVILFYFKKAFEDLLLLLARLNRIDLFLFV